MMKLQGVNLRFVLLLSGSITLVNCMPSPQNNGVSVDDILAAAGNDSTRYGTNQGNINQDLLNDVFGGGSPKTPETSGAGGNNDGDGPDYYEDTFDSDNGNPTVQDDAKYDNCSYYEGDGYECVPYYSCKKGVIITDGSGLFDIRSNLLDPLTSKCPSYLEVCCRLEDYIYDPEPTRPPPASTPRPVTKVPVTEPPVQPTSKPPHSCPGPSCPYRNRCGKRNQGGIGVRIQNLDRISSGTQFGEWPHMCAVLEKKRVNGKDVNAYVCGGSLIAPGVVLTGAHCVNDIKDSSRVVVRCGEWDTQQQIEPLKHVDKYAKHISIHPAFNSQNLQNDFALIHLKEEFQLSQHINTICLPDPYETGEKWEDENCFATGWGKDKFGSDGNYQVIMKQVEMDTVDHGVCENKLKNSKLGRKFKLHDTFLCAGGEPGKDTCEGDGGGPLVCPSKSSSGQYVQAGIVAWGIGCGSEKPGVYADVSKALRFIDWATKCVDGPEADYYGFDWDSRWAKRQYCKTKDRIDELEANIEATNTRLKGITQRSEVRAIRKSLRPLTKEMRGLKKEAPLYQASISNCATGKRDFDCSLQDYDEFEDERRDVDISSLARDKNAANNKKDGSEEQDDSAETPRPRIGLKEDEGSNDGVSFGR